MKKILDPKELKALYQKGDFAPHTPEKIFHDAKDNFEGLKTAPFFGEETLGIYVDIYKKLGEMNFSPALYELGLLYYHGEFWLPQDLKVSFDYHIRAAELGNSLAMFELYVYYSTGIHVDIDNTVALDYCHKAAAAKNKRACYNLGAFYATGNGVEKDIDKAISWYEEASNLGDVKSTETLGYMFKHGEDVEQNEEKADAYFALAKKQRADFMRNMA